jgi:hypothetical protein
VAPGGAHVFAARHIAKAAATTASVWFAQGFVQDEDLALRKAVADYEKASRRRRSTRSIGACLSLRCALCSRAAG